MINLTTTDILTCPACHQFLEPEYRIDIHRGKAPGVVIRVRCSRCGRLWKGGLHQVDEDRLYA